MNRVYDKRMPECRKVAASPRIQALKGMKAKLLLVAQGALGGLIGGICCLLPAVAIAIGLTGGLASTLVSLGQFRLYGVIVGLAFVAVASWFSLRRSRSCCTVEEYKRRQIAVPLTMLSSFGAVYALVMYLVLPLLYHFH